MNIKMQPVDSKFIKAIGHSGKLLLKVEFEKKTFLYFGFSADKFKAFQDAGSKGTFWHAMVKGKYEFEEVEHVAVDWENLLWNCVIHVNWHGDDSYLDDWYVDTSTCFSSEEKKALIKMRDERED